MAMPKPFPVWSTYPGHGGIDFPKSSGTAIPAITDGVVTFSGWWNDNAGNTKTITRSDGLKIMYCHLVNLNGAGVGTRVSVGQTVGYVGSTGRSTGPHLHLEMWLNGVAQDEWRWMDKNATVGIGQGAGGVGGDWNDVQRQTFLTSIGLDTGGIGNGWGPMSAAATKQFQQWVGLTDDSLFGPGTIAVAKTIIAGGNRTNRPTSEIQSFLNSKNFNVGAVDNDWGNKTSLGAYRFQRSVGLLPDALWGAATDAKAFPPPPVPSYPTNGFNGSTRPTKDIQEFLISKGYDLGPTGADNDYGPATSVAVAKFQEANGLDIDGSWGPNTDAKAVEQGGFKDENGQPEPEPGQDEAALTPNLVSPTAADFPEWIQFEVKLDQQYVATKDRWNTDSFNHYKVKYNPIESHTHWWGEPGKSGTHDGNVDYLNRTKDVGANFVVSAGRVTMTMPINKNALTTGGRNPYAWKSENDPLITTSTSDLGYKTLGYLHYIVEKLNPVLLNEPIRLHKEFYSTSCSLIATLKVRDYAEKFRTGALDPATGLPPVVGPDPDPEDVIKGAIQQKLDEISELVDEL